ALLLLNRYRSIFAEDDVEAFTVLAGHAAALARRAQTSAERESLAAIVESSHDAIIGKTLDGVITSWNAAAEKLFGYPAGDIVGHPIRTLVPPDREREQTVRFQRVLRGSAAQEWETERLRADGTALPVSITLSAVRDRSGTTIGLAAVIRDLSERLRYRREHRIAQTLQRSLVPAELPDTPGLRFASRYLAGVADIDVSGDWYDVIPLSPVRIGAVMGDVVGRGVEAAAAMGQLRSALRIYALDGLSPGAVLERLNQLVHRFGAGDFSTLCYLSLDPATGVVVYACAGHPYPLLLTPGDAPRYLDGGRSLPLGVAPDALYCEAATLLTPGSTLLLYTDGIIESRTQTIDDGLTGLAATAATGPTDLDELLDHLLDQVLNGETEDDIALLAIRRLPE
ncbi:MAG TPA: SpoIIE family protein phosphatase, partial [Acidimicrobiia bacterium]|nr:SpoIIE family protein phosphatase [Acidimicrobiia bacterium]